MELSLKINLGETPDQNTLVQLITAAYQLDKPTILTRVDGISLTEYPVAAVREDIQQVFQEVTGAVRFANGDAVDTGSEYEQEEDGAEVQTSTDEPVKAKRKGRRSNAQIAADKAATEALIAGTKAEMEPPAQSAAEALIAGTKAEMEPPAQSAAGTKAEMEPPAQGITFPPGVEKPQVEPATTPVQTAMPTVQSDALPATDPDGVVPLDVFKSAYMSTNSRFPNKPWIIMKATTWPDGTPKEGWFLAENVPPECRERLLQIWSTLS